MAITQQIRKTGNSYVVTIPRAEMERLRLREGDTVSLDVTPMELKPKLRDDLAAILESDHEAISHVMRYLADK